MFPGAEVLIQVAMICASSVVLIAAAFMWLVNAP